MRAFNPDGFLRDVHPAVNEHFARANHLEILPVEFLKPDGSVAVIKRRPLRGIIVDNPCAAVVIKEDGRVDAAEIQTYRVRPRADRVFGSDNEIAHIINHRTDDVEQAVMVRNSRSKQTAAGSTRGIVQLFGTMDDVADLLPVDQVSTVKDGNTGEIFECRSNQVVVIADSADTRVRMKAGQNRIAVMTCFQRSRRVNILPAVFELFKSNRGNTARLAGGDVQGEK